MIVPFPLVTASGPSEYSYTRATLCRRTLKCMERPLSKLGLVFSGREGGSKGKQIAESALQIRRDPGAKSWTRPVSHFEHANMSHVRTAKVFNERINQTAL